MRRLGPAALAVLATAAPALAAAAEPRALALAVSDAQGQFVADLRAEELRVLENGEPRELAALRARRAAARRVPGARHQRRRARVFRTQAFDAVWSFVSSLPAGSKCTLWSTGDRPRKLGALDGDRKAVDKKVGQGFASRAPTRSWTRSSRPRARSRASRASGARSWCCRGRGPATPAARPATCRRGAPRGRAGLRADVRRGRGRRRRLARASATRRATPPTSRSSAPPITSGSCRGSRRAPAAASSACRPCSASARVRSMPPSSAASTGSATCRARARGRGGSRCGSRGPACTGASRSTAHEGERHEEGPAGGRRAAAAGRRRRWPAWRLPGLAARHARAREELLDQAKATLGTDARACATWGSRSSPGVTLEGIAVANPAPFRGDLLTADAFVLRYRLLPLLTGRVQVDRLALEKPVLALAMDAKGGFNYEKLGGPRRRARPRRRRPGGPRGARRRCGS